MRRKCAFSIPVALLLVVFISNAPVRALQLPTTTDYKAQIVDYSIDVKYLLGKIDPTKDTAFVKVEKKYCLMRTEYLLREVYNQYQLMYAAAAAEGITLGIVSATRTFDAQKILWERKLAAHENILAGVKKSLNYLSMPGTSRHHWGTDLDFVSVEPVYFNSGNGKRVYDWLCRNGHKYGFYQVYTDNRTGGYLEEKWHWTYLPISKKYLAQYRAKVTYNDISGFTGCQYAQELDVINGYVMNINAKLLN